MNLKRTGLAILVIAMSLLFIFQGCSTKTDEVTNVVPEGYVRNFPVYDDAYFANPNMGWIYYENAMKYVYENASLMTAEDRLGYFDEWNERLGEECTDVAVMSAWGQIEGSAEGVYDWTYYDEAINYWTSKGKSIHLRFCTDNLLFMGVSSPAPQWLSTEYGVPFMEKQYEGVKCYYPDYNNEIYQEKLGNFLQVFADRYKSNPNIKSVDLRGYGLWGEWHSGYNYNTLEERRSGLSAIIEAWMDAWGEDVVVDISVSPETSGISPYFNPQMSASDFMEFNALDVAMQYDNMTFRRDGVGGYIKSQDIQLLNEYYASNKLNPLILEIAMWYGWYEANSTGLTLENIIDEAAMYHGAYLSVIGHDKLNSLKFFTERRDLLESGLHALGYRYKINEVSYNNIGSDRKFYIYHEWENLNFAPSYVDYPLVVSLVDQNDVEVFRSEPLKEFKATSIRNGNTYPNFSELQIPENVPAGNYDVVFTLENPVDDNRADTIRLAIEGMTDNGGYKVGEVNVGEGEGKPFGYARFDDFEGEGIFDFEGGAEVVTSDFWGEQTKVARISSKQGETDAVRLTTKQKLDANSSYRIVLDYKVIETTLNDLYFPNGMTLRVGDSEYSLRGDDGDEITKSITVNTVQASELEILIDDGGTFEIDNVRIIKTDSKVYDFEKEDSSVLILDPSKASYVETTANPRANNTVNDSGALYFNVNSGEDDISLAVVKCPVMDELTKIRISFRTRANTKNLHGGIYYVQLIDKESKEICAQVRWTSELQELNEFSVYEFTGVMQEGRTYEISFGMNGAGKYSVDNLCISYEA